MRGRISSSIAGSPSTARATPARLARSSSSAATASSSGRTATAPSETTRDPDSSSERNSTSSISSRICSTSFRAWSTSSCDVLAGQRRHLEQREQPCERRPQLVRDGRREPGAELLVRRQVAAAAQVDEPLAAAVDVVGDDERHDPGLAGQQPVGDRLALPEVPRSTAARVGSRRSRGRPRRARRRTRGSPRASTRPRLASASMLTAF